MPASIIAVVSNGFGMIMGFVALVGVSTLVAYFAAQSFGRSSRQNRQTIFSIVLVAGIVAALLFTQYRLRHLSS